MSHRLFLRPAGPIPGTAVQGAAHRCGHGGRPCYLCLHCHSGQSPVDIELDVENTEMSPGVRRMLAAVGQDGPFDHGRRQMKLLADLEVTAKAVERTAEVIGADIASGEREEIDRAIRGELPMVPSGPPIPILYVCTWTGPECLW